MQTGIPFDLMLMFKKKCNFYNKREKELHLKYITNNKRGEWFKFTEIELKEVISTIDKLSLYE